MEGAAPALWIRRADLGGRRVDLELRGGRIVALDDALPAAAEGDRELDAAGGAVLPGLHDHHVHLLALAAAEASLRCGPPELRDADAFRRCLRDAAQRPGAIRGVGYHESVAGPLDRDALDAIVSDRPVRIQHRSGACWILNGAALAALDLDSAPAAGIERAEDGRPTGRLFRVDSWLRHQAPGAAPELAPLGRRLVRLGWTGMTDATPDDRGDGARRLADAKARGDLPLRIVTLSRGVAAAPLAVDVGPRKIVLDEPRLPTLDALRDEIAAAHAADRAVAIHCVTRTELFFAIAALEEAGPHRGDRIEHASVAPPEALRALAALGTTVVTQPAFIAERGDQYRADVDAQDQPWLYRCAGFDAAGVALAAGTDAPFGSEDPWAVMRAAVDRRTASGHVIGADEAVTPERALALFTTRWDDPGGRPRSLEVGEAADLTILMCPWTTARDRLDPADVAATVVSGRLVWRAG